MSDFFKESDSDKPYKGWITINKANRLLRERASICIAENGKRYWSIGEYEEPDTAEKLLNDILDYTPGIGPAFLDRARKLIGGSK